MTLPKAKYDPRNWYLNTQFIEIVSAPTERKRANELCDLIMVCVEQLDDSGYDYERILGERMKGHVGNGHAIVSKYRHKWKLVHDWLVKREGK